MPATRKSTGSARGRTGPTKGQSTLSFHNKVTKSVPKDTKKAVVSQPVDKVDPADTASPAKEDVEDVVVDEPDTVKQPEERKEEEVLLKSEAELEAEKVTDAQINKYWNGIEKQRRAPRVHQEDLTVGEKILRYFDVSSQYGPCIGVTRMARWLRADRLGLKPPVEVLAVLLKEEKKGNPGIETAQMDHILSSTAIRAVS